MKIHELKTENPYFTDVWKGYKQFEIRLNDRDFHKNDLLLLKEYNYISKLYSGREIVCKVIYRVNDIQFIGLAKGYTCMGIRVLSKSKGYNYD